MNLIAGSLLIKRAPDIWYKELEWEKSDGIYSQFHTVHERDKQTEGHSHHHNHILYCKVDRYNSIQTFPQTLSSFVATLN